MIGTSLHRVDSQKKKQRYQHIVESTTSIVGLVDQNYVYQYVNDTYCAAFNKDRQAIIGNTVADLFGDSFFEQTIKPQYVKCFAGEKITFQVWFDFPGWGRRYMNVLLSPFFDASRVTAVVVTARDITETKRLEVDLKESEERFRAFMDNTPASIYIKDENDRHIYGNPAAFKSVNRKPDEFIGSITRDLFPSEIADRLCELDQKVREGDSPRVVEEWQNTESDDTRWRRDIKFSIRLQSGKRLLGGIAIDITNQKLAEARLKELLTFNQFLSKLSASFIDLPTERMDESINNALRLIGRFFKLDRCSFGEISADGKEMRVTNVWNRKKPTGTKMAYVVAQYPWLLSPFRTGKVLLWSRLEGLPAGSQADIKLLEETGMQSFAGIPVRVAGRLSNCLGFSNTTEPRPWGRHIVKRFPLIATVFGNLVARQKAEMKLQEAFQEIMKACHYNQ